MSAIRRRHPKVAVTVLLCASIVLVRGALELDEDFSCAEIGCNSTHGITNYSYWRWSTTKSKQSSLSIGPAENGRTGNAVTFDVIYCPPPNPNPDHLGCYRSELALQRDVQDSLIPWTPYIGSNERWFGFSNRLVNFTFDGVDGIQLSGPIFQIHGGGGLPQYKAKHPVVNLQVDATGCSASNRSCPSYNIEVSNNIDPAAPRCAEQYPHCWSLGPALDPKTDSFGEWQDWVIRWKGSPSATGGYLQVWRNGIEVLPTQTLATAYNDTISPYMKFGVYRGVWKGTGRPTVSKRSTTAYGGIKVGDEHSSFDEVSTAQGKTSGSGGR